MKAKVFSFFLAMSVVQACGANPQSTQKSKVLDVRVKDNCIAMAKAAAEKADKKRTPLLPGQLEGVAISTESAVGQTNSFTSILIVTVIRDSDIVELGKYIDYKVTLRTKGASEEGCSAVTKVKFLKEFGNARFETTPRIGVGN